MQLFAAMSVKAGAQNKGGRSRLGSGLVAQPAFNPPPDSSSFMVACVHLYVCVPALAEASVRPPIELYVKVSQGKISISNYF